MTPAAAIAVAAAAMTVLGLTCNDWLPTGLLHDVGAVGNTDRRDALRGLSIIMPLCGLILYSRRDWVARRLGDLVALSISTALSLALLVCADVYLSRNAAAAPRDTHEINDVHIPDPLLGWRPRPGATGHHREEGSFAVDYHIDDDGYKAISNRGIPVSRLFVFGDSYTFGHGVGNDDTYANVIARDHLSDAIHVFNAGVMGYGIEQMYGRFLEIEPRLQRGDFVVFAPTSQDLKRNLKDFVFPSKLIFGKRLDFGDRYPYYRDGRLESVELGTPWNTVKAMLFNGRWTKRIFRFLHSAITSPPTTMEAKEMIDRVRAMSERRGARFALFFLPQTKECRDRTYEEDVSAFKFDDLMRFFPDDEAGLAALRFRTDTHWNPSGHTLAAGAIVESMLAQGLLEMEQLRATRPFPPGRTSVAQP